MYNHLQPYEQAARIYCAKSKIDPDEMLPMPHPTIADAIEPVPQWALVAADLVDFSMKLAAIQEAAKTPVPQTAIQ